MIDMTGCFYLESNERPSHPAEDRCTAEPPVHRVAERGSGERHPITGNTGFNHDWGKLRTITQYIHST